MESKPTAKRKRIADHASRATNRVLVALDELSDVGNTKTSLTEDEIAKIESALLEVVATTCKTLRNKLVVSRTRSVPRFELGND